MSSKQIQHMMRNPRALIKFQTTGQLPREQSTPSTPLRDLIDQIPPRLRVRFKGVSLSPKLGFNSSERFYTLQQLHQWLGAGETIIGNRTLPYMTRRNAGFRKKLTVNDLLEHCAEHPDEETLKKSLSPKVYFNKR